MDVRGYIDENAAGFFDGLRQWAAIPSISADPAHRGLVEAEIDLRGPEQDLHSGPFGGAVPNPLHALTELLAEASVTVPGPGVRPSFSPVDSPAVRAARRAMERAFGSEVLFTREGGSGPEADLADSLGAPLVFVAVGLDSDRIHAPNEKVGMSLLLKGAEAAAHLWDEFATVAGDLTAAR